jgi:benzoate membrane transport protein
VLERIQLPIPALGRVLSDFGAVYAANAVVAFLFAASGPIAIILAVGAMGGLSESDISSWIFGSLFINGIITIIFSLLYRQPLAFFWTIPGAVLVGPALGHLSYPEVIGAFHVTGVLMLLLGLSGWVRRTMASIPMPIVMAMVAGVFLRFGTGVVHAFRDDIAVALPMALVFLLISCAPRIARYVPPLIGALLAGALAVWLLGSFRPPSGALFSFASPNLYQPQWSWAAMVELVVPIAITVLVVQNGQGMAVLSASGHRAPINAITVGCGAGSVLAALVGTVPTCLTGPVNAVITSSGDKHRQYTAAIAVGIFAIIFGLMSPLLTRLMLGAPPAFIATLAGLAMLRVLQNAFIASFRDRFSFGALITFIVTVGDVALWNIGAPFWGLLIGIAVSWLLEREDFKRPRAQDN